MPETLKCCFSEHFGMRAFSLTVLGTVFRVNKLEGKGGTCLLCRSFRAVHLSRNSESMCLDRLAVADSLGLSIVIHQLQSIDKVVDVPVGRFCSSTGAVCEKTVRSYSCCTWKSWRW